MKTIMYFARKGAVMAIFVSWAQATDVNDTSSPGNSGTNSPPGQQVPKPGDCNETTPVKFKKNNGWGNGDQDPPGNSGDHNNAENGPGDPPPGIAKKSATSEQATLDALSQLDSQAGSDIAVARRVK